MIAVSLCIICDLFRELIYVIFMTSLRVCLIIIPASTFWRWTNEQNAMKIAHPDRTGIGYWITAHEAHQILNICLKLSRSPFDTNGGVIPACDSVADGKVGLRKDRMHLFHGGFDRI
ncbi:hypothetical protein C8R48DRAFT_284633 [Suillus tomentosus]|nr:hypothetical protein C8R48DRAFT_284633 [Suillus tomentosus]